MSEKPEHDSKTEEATEKRLGEAIEKGNVPVSREAGTFASLAAFLLASVLFLRDGARRLLDAFSRMMDDAGGWSLQQSGDATVLFQAWLGACALFVGPILFLILAFGLAAAVVQNPPHIVLDRIKPELSRISPSGGWTRLFGSRGRIEFGKAAFKLAALAVILGLLLRSEGQAAIALMMGDPNAIPDRLLATVVKLLAAVTLAAGVLAAADLVWARLSWRRELRMTRHEVREEHKEAEGDPMVRARRRSIALNRSRKRMMSAVPKATLVIANPTHYAVALRYVREEGGVPLVVAKGQDLVAFRIRAIAEANGVPVIENKALARSMHEAVQVDQMIPPSFYRAVAELIHYLQTRSPAHLRGRP
jgi:flagellar biosynthesis protein FlhB